jgi:starvation-inducible DNA-binding protein
MRDARTARGVREWNALSTETGARVAGSSLSDDLLQRGTPDAKRHAMYKSPSSLSDRARNHIADALNACLADGLDLHGQIKVAHWNIKGPLFPSLHPLFETFAVGLAAHNDTIAERAVTLGGKAFGTARHVATHSRLAKYPQDTTRDKDHVRLLADRFGAYLDGLREARGIVDQHADTDTVDILTAAITEFEKHSWFLRASLES